MERLALACGGFAVNSFDDLTEDALGYADAAYEHVLGEDKFTFVEGCRKANSCTILIKGTPMPRCILVNVSKCGSRFCILYICDSGPNEHTIRQIKDAVNDGLRAVTNVVEDQFLVR